MLQSFICSSTLSPAEILDFLINLRTRPDWINDYGVIFFGGIKKYMKWAIINIFHLAVLGQQILILRWTIVFSDTQADYVKSQKIGQSLCCLPVKHFLEGRILKLEGLTGREQSWGKSQLSILTIPYRAEPHLPTALSIITQSKCDTLTKPHSLTLDMLTSHIFSEKTQQTGSLGGLISNVTPQNWFANRRVPSTLSYGHSPGEEFSARLKHQPSETDTDFFHYGPTPLILSFFHIDSYTTKHFFFLSTSPNSYTRASLACTSHRCVMNLTHTVSTQDILIIPLSFSPSRSCPK